MPIVNTCMRAKVGNPSVVSLWADDYRKHRGTINWAELCRLVGAQITDRRIEKLKQTAEQWLGVNADTNKACDLITYSLDKDGTIKQLAENVSRGSDHRDQSFSDSTYWDEEI